MPALNIEFTEDELATIRARANEKGVSMRTHVHDAVLTCGTQADKDARVAAALAHLKSVYAQGLAELADK